MGRLSRGLQGLAKDARLKVLATWNATLLSDAVFGQSVEQNKNLGKLDVVSILLQRLTYYGPISLFMPTYSLSKLSGAHMLLPFPEAHSPSCTVVK